MKVQVRQIGVNLRTPVRAFKYLYKGVSPYHTRLFYDGSRVSNGEYELPDDQWDAKSQHFMAQCDACGMTYDALGQEGTTIECPYCGENEIVHL